MDKKRLDKFFEKLAKMDPKPVITVTERCFGKDKKCHLYKHTGVFGSWNGEACFFESRKSRNRKLKSVVIFMPFCGEYIASVKITTQQEMINDRNFLFDLLERIRDREHPQWLDGSSRIESRNPIFFQCS